MKTFVIALIVQYRFAWVAFLTVIDYNLSIIWFRHLEYLAIERYTLWSSKPPIIDSLRGYISSRSWSLSWQSTLAALLALMPQSILMALSLKKRSLARPPKPPRIRTGIRTISLQSAQAQSKDPKLILISPAYPSNRGYPRVWWTLFFKTARDSYGSAPKMG